MAKKQIIKKATLAKKKKKWYEVVAPLELRSVPMGETPASDPQALIGRVIKQNMMTLTRDMKKQNIIVSVKIKEIKENKALTDLTGYELTSAHVKRLVKRSRSKIEDSFKCKTKDGVTVVIKPLLLIKNKVQKEVLRGLRKAAREVITKTAAEKRFSELAVMVMATELQKIVKQNSKKIYPVNMVDIRVLKKL